MAKHSHLCVDTSLDPSLTLLNLMCLLPDCHYCQCQKGFIVGTNNSFPTSVLLRLVLQQHLPFADDSNAVTPLSEENGAILVPHYGYHATLGSRQHSYTSHTSRASYTSHADLLPHLGQTKEARLRSRSRNSSDKQCCTRSSRDYVSVSIGN